MISPIYRVSIKSFPDYKHLLQENHVEYKHIFLPLFKLVSKILCHVFIVMLQLHNLLVSKWRQWRRKPSVFCGITKQNHQSQCNENSEISTDYLRQMLKASKRGIQSSRYYKFEGKNNRRFCYNNWRHVGEHVKRNWLSIRCSPCNKRSTCWSVLMCCKKTSWVELHFEKKICLYST